MMDAVTKDKLATNIGASYKMATIWAAGMLSAAGVGLLAMPEGMRTTLLSHLPVPAWALPIVSWAVVYIARVWPQYNITPAEAAAKSDTTPTAGKDDK